MLHNASVVLFVTVYFLLNVTSSIDVFKYVYLTASLFSSCFHKRLGFSSYLHLTLPFMPFLLIHLILNLIIGLVSTPYLSLLSSCLAVLHRWVKWAWLIKACPFVFPYNWSSIKGHLLDGHCVGKIFFFLILCPFSVLIWWLFLDLKTNLLVFIATPSKIQALTNTTTLETGFGTRFKCWVCGLMGLRHMTFSEKKE